MAENRTRCGWANFTVVGHTDRSGPDAYNDGLALRRAHAIPDMMGGAGIPAGTVAVSGMGERQPPVQTVDGQRTPEQRRVEVEGTQTGRASRRDRVCQDVSISVGAGTLKKKQLGSGSPRIKTIQTK